MRLRLGVLALVTACGGAPADDPDAEVTADTVSSREVPLNRPARRPDAVPRQDTVLAMPDVPDAERGHLAARSAGPDTLEGAWPARAGRCADPRSFLVISDAGDVGVALLLMRPDSGGAATAYPVIPLDSAVVPGTARLGVHRFEGTQARGFEAVEGTLVLSESGARLSGEVTARLVRLMLRDTVLFAARFAGIPVRPLGAAECAMPVADTTGPVID